MAANACYKMGFECMHDKFICNAEHWGTVADLFAINILSNVAQRARLTRHTPEYCEQHPQTFPEEMEVTCIVIVTF